MKFYPHLLLAALKSDSEYERQHLLMTMQEAQTSGLTFDKWLRQHPNYKPFQRNALQLEWETLQQKEKPNPSSGKFVVVEPDGLPDRSEWKTTIIHHSQQEAAAHGCKKYGKGKFVIVPYHVFINSAKGKFMLRFQRNLATLQNNHPHLQKKQPEPEFSFYLCKRTKGKLVIHAAISKKCEAASCLDAAENVFRIAGYPVGSEGWETNFASVRQQKNCSILSNIAIVSCSTEVRKLFWYHQTYSSPVYKSWEHFLISFPEARHLKKQLSRPLNLEQGKDFHIKTIKIK